VDRPSALPGAPAPVRRFLARCPDCGAEPEGHGEDLIAALADAEAKHWHESGFRCPGELKLLPPRAPKMPRRAHWLGDIVPKKPIDPHAPAPMTEAPPPLTEAPPALAPVPTPPALPPAPTPNPFRMTAEEAIAAMDRLRFAGVTADEAVRAFAAFRSLVLTPETEARLPPAGAFAAPPPLPAPTRAPGCGIVFGAPPPLPKPDLDIFQTEER
jgi:hypothetical protein